MAVFTFATVMASTAFAVPVSFAFEGMIDFYRVFTADPLGGLISVGTPFRGRYVFDTGITNAGTSDYGVYVSDDPQLGIDVQIGSFTGESSTAKLPLHYRIIMGGLPNGSVIQDLQTHDMDFGGFNASLVQIFLRVRQM